MKTAQEIFAAYFSQNIAINDQEEFERRVIIPAMEDYAQLQSRLAFEAARKTDSQTGNLLFNSYSDYSTSLFENTQEDHKANIIREVADSILPQYIPANGAAQSLAFSFTIEGNLYKVNYYKDADGYWQFNNYSIE